MPYWKLYYHITFSVKDRLPLILLEFEESLHAVIAAKAVELGGQVLAVGGIDDHVHLVVSVPPKISLSEFIGQIKGNSSHWVNHILILEGQFAWQNEYGVVSFSEKQLPVVIEYVKRQREHHQCQSIIPMWEQNSSQ